MLSQEIKDINLTTRL